MRRVDLIATLDTKGHEADFVRRILVSQGHAVRLIDVGCLGQAEVTADVPRVRVFESAGASLDACRAAADRGEAVRVAAEGVSRLVSEAHAKSELLGVISLGGSAGTTIGTAAMRALPIGVPKVMVSTMASGQVRPYVADKDILMLNSVVDIAGINRISHQILSNAAHALSGMIRGHSESGMAVEERPLIAATMFGVTTPCVEKAREVLESAGYEVLVFHATGNGGQAMESLIRDGLIAGVLDITTTELADELVGGVLSAGPFRMTAAAEMGVPQVVSVGATDMVNFGPRESIDSRFESRLLYVHNPTVTLMRVNKSEAVELGVVMRNKLSKAKGAACLMLPLQGVSAIDKSGQPFENPAAREAMFDQLRQISNPQVSVEEWDAHINDEAFAEACARRLLDLLNE